MTDLKRSDGAVRLQLSISDDPIGRTRSQRTVRLDDSVPAVRGQAGYPAHQEPPPPPPPPPPEKPPPPNPDEPDDDGVAAAIEPEVVVAKSSIELPNAA